MSDAQANPATIERERGERFDVIVAALTAVATSASFILAILTPPKGGPFCTARCVEYPYTDANQCVLRQGRIIMDAHGRRMGQRR